MRPFPPLALGPLVLAAAGILLPPGARLHLEPDPESVSVTVVDEEVELEPVETRDGWVLVRYLGYLGWVRTSGADEPLSRIREERAPRPASTGPDFIEESRRLLRNGGREITLERWRLLTDVDDQALLDRLSLVVGTAPAHFRTWWELSTVPASGTAVFLFSRPDAARSVHALACGRARAGVVTATLAEGDAEATIRDVLHQVGHLYALDLLGPAAPPWLEEGLADSFAALAEHGPGQQEPLCPSRGFECEGIETPPLPAVLAAGRELFSDDGRGRALRLGARRLCRYFWNGGSVARLERFRALLIEVGSGKPLLDSTMEKHLRTDLPTLDLRIRSFREARPSKGRAPIVLGG